MSDAHDAHGMEGMMSADEMAAYYAELVDARTLEPVEVVLLDAARADGIDDDVHAHAPASRRWARRSGATPGWTRACPCIRCSGGSGTRTSARRRPTWR